MRLFVLSAFLLLSIPLIFINPYVGVLLYSWISFMNPHRLAWGFPDAIPLAMMAAVGTLICWVFSREPKRLPANATVWLIIILVVYVTANTLIALNPAVAWIRWDRTVKMLGFTLVIIALTSNRIRLHCLIWVMAISIGFYGFKGGLNSVANGGVNLIYGPPDSMIGDNNDLALALAVMLPIMNYLRVNSAVSFVRIGLLVVMIASSFAIVTTYSRGGLLALTAVSFLMWVKSEKKLLTLVTLSIVALVMLQAMPSKWFARMDTIIHYQQDASAEGRLDIWGVAITIAKERPLTGGGFGATYSQAVVNTFDPGVRARAPHSIYFEIIGEQGFVVLAIWATIGILAWRNARWIERFSRKRPDKKWAYDFARMSQVSMLGYCVGGGFASFAWWDCYFTIIGLLLAVRCILERNPVVETAETFVAGSVVRHRFAR
jgi:probable O-glycosylation ligase (exosortase A-associated)